MNIIKRNGSEAVFEKAKILARALAGGFAVASQPSLASLGAFPSAVASHGWRTNQRPSIAQRR